MADDTPPLTSDNEPRIPERGIAQVAGPSRQNNVLVVVFGLGIVFMLLFFIWNSTGNTTSTKVDVGQPKKFETVQAEPPPLPKTVQPPEPPAGQKQPYDPFELELRRMALERANEQQALAKMRRRAPSKIYSKRASAQSAIGNASVSGTPSNQPALIGQDTGASEVERFAARVGTAQVETVRASALRSPSRMIAQGTLIRGVIESAIQSDLPGLIRAIVSHDVYSFDGSRVLIPRASRLIGEYKAGLRNGETRIFVIWTRVLRPDGVSIMVGSPGTDLLGRAGMEAEIDTHFFKRFGASIMLSLIGGVIDVAVADARDQGDNSTSIIDNSGSSLSRAAEIALERFIDIPTTGHTDQGDPIQVFIAKDLDFSSVEPM